MIPSPLLFQPFETLCWCAKVTILLNKKRRESAGMQERLEKQGKRLDKKDAVGKTTRSTGRSLYVC